MLIIEKQYGILAWHCLPAFPWQRLLPEHELRDEHLGHEAVESGLFVAKSDLDKGVIELLLVLDALREDGVDCLYVGMLLLVLVHEVLERGGGAPISVLSEDSRSHLVQSRHLDRVWPFTDILGRHSVEIDTLIFINQYDMSIFIYNTYRFSLLVSCFEFATRGFDARIFETRLAPL